MAKLDRAQVTVEVLRELLDLDEETGLLYWRERPRAMFATERVWLSWNAKHAGREAFTARLRAGYRCGRIYRHHYLAHRVVFAIAHGRWPEGEVDHRDRNPTNNRPGNLREATHAENLRNSRKRPKSSPFKGVWWSPRLRKWVAEGRDNSGKKHVVGYFTDEVVAARAYDDFARENHAEFALLNFPVAA